MAVGGAATEQGGAIKSARLLADLTVAARQHTGQPTDHALAEHAVLELSHSEGQARFLADLFRRIGRLVNRCAHARAAPRACRRLTAWRRVFSNDTNDKLGAVYAILELIDVPVRAPRGGRLRACAALLCGLWPVTEGVRRSWAST